MFFTRFDSSTISRVLAFTARLESLAPQAEKERKSKPSLKLKARLPIHSLLRTESGC